MITRTPLAVLIETRLKQLCIDRAALGYAWDIKTRQRRLAACTPCATVISPAQKARPLFSGSPEQSRCPQRSLRLL